MSVTAFDRTAEIRDCLAAGADGCLLKDSAEVDLAAPLRAILDGESTLDPRIAQRLAAGERAGLACRRPSRLASARWMPAAQGVSVAWRCRC